MSVAVVGISHRTAPLAVRERFALDAGASERALDEVRGAGCAEAVLLSTCNRTELYVSADPALTAEQVAAEFLGRHAAMSGESAAQYLYVRREQDAVEHLFRVVSSLDSMILGEAQIQGQVRSAYDRACSAANGTTVGPVLARLFEIALRVGARVRSETRLGSGAASVPSAAIELARKIFGDLTGRSAVVLGAGEMSELTIACLRSAGVADLTIANRTASRAESIAERVGAEYAAFAELPGLLQRVDIVASATAAPHHVLTADMVLPAASARRTPLLILDIALPRDVEPAVAELPNTFLYDVDDLSRVVEGTLQKRRSEIALAEEIVREGIAEFTNWQRARDVVPLIRALRGRAEQLRESEVERTLRALDHLSDADRQAVENMTRALLNKVLHAPTARLREAAENGQGPVVVDAARYLFDLDNGTHTNGS